MKAIEIFGQSDDNIYVMPSGEHGQQFSGGDEPRYLFFADGTVLYVIYGDHGIWRIERVKVGTAEYERVEGKSPDDDRYSDTVWLRGESLCKPGTNTAAPVECWQNESGPTSDELQERIVDCDWGEIPIDVMRAFYSAARDAGAIR